MREAYELTGKGVAQNPLHHAIAARMLGETALMGEQFEVAKAFADEALHGGDQAPGSREHARDAA